MEQYDTHENALLLETTDKYAAGAAKEFPIEALRERVTPENFNWPVIREGARAGFLTAPLPESQGGIGLSGYELGQVLVKMAAARAGLAAIYALHWAGLMALAAHQEHDQVRAWLADFAARTAGNKPPLCGIAVPAAVIDLKAEAPIGVTAENLVTIRGDFLCPLHPAVTASVVMIVPGTDGELRAVWAGEELASSCREVYPGTGLLEAPMARLFLNDFKAPAISVLAQGPKALETAAILWQELYLGLAAVMVGNARAAESYAWEYARERVQTGRLIIEHQEVRRMLEHMATLNQAAGAMAAEVSRKFPGNDLAEARRAYAFVGGACEQVCLDAIQCLGGYGYMEDYGLERRLRDHKTLQCLLGSYVQDWVGPGQG